MQNDIDYLDPVKSVYSVPYKSIKRFCISLLCASAAYVLGAGPSVLVKNFAAIPANMIACVWTGPMASLAIPFTLFAFVYIVFTERPLRIVVAALMILVYSHCFSWGTGRWMSVLWRGLPFWWVAAASLGVGVSLYFLYKLLRRNCRG